MPESESFSIPFLELLSQAMSADFWSGYISGAAGILIGNPLDLIKTRIQAGNGPTPAPTSTSTSGIPIPPPQSLRAHFDRAGTLVRGAFNPTNTVLAMGDIDRGLILLAAA